LTAIATHILDVVHYTTPVPIGFMGSLELPTIEHP